MKSLNDTFNIEEVDVTPVRSEVITQSGEVILPRAEDDNSAVQYDYDKTRSNLHSLLMQGQDALEHALEVAKQSEHPRAFEVVGNLVKQLADVNQQLLELSEKKQKLMTTASNSPHTVNNNAFFVGSTADLNKLLKDMTKGDNT